MNAIPLWKHDNLNTFNKCIFRDESRDDLFNMIKEISEKSITIEYERKNKKISKNEIDLLIDNVFKYNNYNKLTNIFINDIKKYFYSKFSLKFISEESSFEV